MTECRTLNEYTGPGTAATTGLKPVARFAWLVVAYNIVVILRRAHVRAAGCRMLGASIPQLDR
jgi:hypothetical protein